MSKRYLLLPILLLLSQLSLAAKVFTLPQQNNLSNDPAWQSNQKKIQATKQDISTNDNRIQQNIQQQSSQFQQLLDSQAGGESESQALDTTPAKPEMQSKPETSTQPDTPATPPTGLPANKTTNQEQQNGSSWQYGF